MPGAMPAGQTLKKLTVNKNMQYILYLIKTKFAHRRKFLRSRKF